jgi:hypothetical protein
MHDCSDFAQSEKGDATDSDQPTATAPRRWPRLAVALTDEAELPFHPPDLETVDTPRVSR